MRVHKYLIIDLSIIIIIILLLRHYGIIILLIFEKILSQTMRLRSSGRAFQRIAHLYVLDVCPSELLKDWERCIKSRNNAGARNSNMNIYILVAQEHEVSK